MSVGRMMMATGYVSSGVVCAGVGFAFAYGLPLLEEYKFGLGVLLLLAGWVLLLTAAQVCRGSAPWISGARR